jgi:cytochrome P450
MTAGNARGLDRRVYLRRHPVLFALLAVLRRTPVRRLGRTLVVNGREDYLAALTRIPLDRTADGTTGGAVERLAGAGGLFDQQGEEHRRTRRDVAERLGSAGVESLRPVWTELLDERLAPLRDGGRVDLVPLAAEIAGATAAALLDLDVDPFELAAAAQEAGAAAAKAHLPGVGRKRAAARAEIATQRLIALVAGGERRPANGADPAGGTHPAGGADPAGGTHPARGADPAGGTHPARGADPAAGRGDAGLAATLAVAAVNTTVAALPRAAAWACGDGLWAYGQDLVLVDELLRVTAPTPLLPRVAAGDGELGGCPVRKGDRMLLIARHAAEAHRRDPDPACPAPMRTARLVFGAGPHACPGAQLARRQLGDLLAALAPHRPIVVAAKVDRSSALPSWRKLIVQAAK